MKDHHVPQEHLSAFARRLAEEERSAGTVEKYLRDAGAFAGVAGGGAGEPGGQSPAGRPTWSAPATSPATINAMLAALNSLSPFHAAWQDCRVKCPAGPAQLFRERGAGS